MVLMRRRHSVTVWVVCGLLWGCAVGVRAQDAAPPGEGFQVHPENTRYFRFRGQPVVLVTSGEHYGLLLNRAFDFNAYFDELAAHGLNHSRVFSGAYREVEGSFGITQNTLAPKHADYVCPWQRTGREHPGGSPIFDLEKWDATYFERLHEIVRAADERNIILELTLFSPMYKPVLWDVNPMNVRNNVNGVGDCGSLEVFNAKYESLVRVQQELARKLVQELADYDNLYFEICNEPYFGGVTDAWQRQIIDAVAAAQKEVGCEKLISVNVANKTAKIVNPHPAVDLFNFHYCHPPIVLAENWQIAKPIGENETGFRGAADFLYRTEGWDFMVAGGALFNNLDYSFSVSHPRGTLADYRSPGGGSRALRQQLGVLRSVFQALPLMQLEPQAKGLVVDDDGLIVSAIGQPETEYLIYAHVPLPGKLGEADTQPYLARVESASLIVQLPPGTYSSVQIDTQTGARLELPPLHSSDEPVALQLGAFQTDAAVHLKRTR